MATWGKSNNGAWKLGYDLTVASETATYTDVRLRIYIWTRYATFDHINTFRVWGDWSFNGDASFSVSTNSSWSTSNIAKIYDNTKRFNKTYAGFSVDFGSDLTGIEYPSFSYKESVSGSKSIAPMSYSTPAAPSAVTATRVADNNIVISWTNNNPTSSSAPYQNIIISATEATTGTTFQIAKTSVKTSHTWTGGQANKRYTFTIKASNRDKTSTGANSNLVYTTPAAPADLSLGLVSIVGSNDPKSLSAGLSWSYPSNNGLSVNEFELSWVGPSSGSLLTANKSATATGLVAGGTYTFSVVAKNIGDGSADLTGAPISIIRVMPNVPTQRPIVTADSAVITGSVEPRTSSVTLTWTASQEATSYVVKSNGSTVATTANTFATISGLASGTQHIFYVYPVNEIGTGLPSDPIARTTAGLPGAPTITKLTPLSDSLEVTISAGFANGSPIIKYQYRVTEKAGSEVVPWTDVPGMSFTIAGMDSSKIYTLYVRSINGVGTGSALSLSSDSAGGRIAIWNGSKFDYAYIRTSAGIAPVRVFNGTSWVLTNN